MSQEGRQPGRNTERQARFVEIRSPKTGKLLLRVDPDRDILEVRERMGDVYTFDLTRYRSAETE